jgi:hypothetical protein
MNEHPWFSKAKVATTSPALNIRRSNMPVSGRLNIEPEFMTFGTYDDGGTRWDSRPDCDVIPSNWVYSWKHEGFDWGEWVDTVTGFRCVIKRNWSGAWCGYVLVPDDHPIHVAEATDEEYHKNLESGNPVWLDVHGGVTLHGHIKIPSTGEEARAVGFDCSHCHDRAPGSVAWTYDDAGNKTGYDPQTYRTASFAIDEVRSLARQIFFYRPLQQLAI